MVGFLVGLLDGLKDVGLSVAKVVGNSEGSKEVSWTIEGSFVWSAVDVSVGPDVGVSKLDDDIILFVSFNCSDRLSWLWSLDKSFSMYDDESNTRFKFIRVIESRKDKKSYHSIHSPDVSIDRRLGCWIIANVKDNDHKIDNRHNIFLCSWRYERLT